MFHTSGVTFIVNDGNEILDQTEVRTTPDNNNFYVVNTYKNGILKGSEGTGVSISEANGAVPATTTYG